MTIDPKTKFRKSPNGKLWNEAVASEWFQEGLATALVTMSLNTPLSPDMATAAAICARAEGAKQLVAILMNMTETASETKSPGMPHNLKPTQ